MLDYGVQTPPPSKGEKKSNSSFEEFCQSLRSEKTKQEVSYARLEKATGNIVSVDTIRRLIKGQQREQRLENICLVSYALGVRLPFISKISEMEKRQILEIESEVVQLLRHGNVNQITDGRAILGQWICSEREYNGWSQQELADMAGITRKTVVAVEKGNTGSTYDTMRKIARALDTLLPDLIPLTPAKISEILQAGIEIRHGYIDRLNTVSYTYD